MTVSERVFRLLVRLYPRAFRERYQDDLLAFFRQDRAHPKYGRGGLRPIRFWTATLRDLVRVAWSERRLASERRHGRAHRSRRRLSLAWVRSDLRFAWRGLRATPAVTLSALAVLTLGIGASTAIFSVVDGVVLRRLPFDEDHRLLSLAEVELASGRPTTVAPQNYFEWRARQDVFEALGASLFAPRLTTRDLPVENLRAVRITASLFDVLRVAPAIGRRFHEGDEIAGRPPVAILSDRLWRRRFNARPDIAGQRLAVEGGDVEIVGVMAADFVYPVGSAVVSTVDLWMPFAPTARDTTRGPARVYNLSVLGRLKPGASFEDAAARMTQIHAALAVQYPQWFTDHGVLVRRWQDAVVGASIRSWMLLLLGAVGVVLLIACLNVANLLVARAEARRRELAVRTALGASRWQLTRALVFESVLLSMTGAVCGVLAALWGVEILRSALPGQVPRLANVVVDLRVLGVASATAFATGVLFGTLPALQLSRPDIAVLLGRDGRALAGRRSGSGLRGALVIAEVALAVILLAGAGLFLTSFMRVVGTDLGLDPHRVISLTVRGQVIDPSRYGPATTASARLTLAGARTRMLSALDRVRAVPGVLAVSPLTGGLPLGGSGFTVPVKIPGGREFTGDDEAAVHAAGPAYLTVMGATLADGRWIDERDVDGAPAVVILSDDAARRYFNGERAVNRPILLDGIERVVVGIVRRMRLKGPEGSVEPEAYVPFLQTTHATGEIVVRTATDPAAIAPALQAAIRAAVPDALVEEPETIERYFTAQIARRKFNMIVLSLFGVVAVAIAAVGVYGLMAYLVSQRTREIGVRVALGAGAGGILRMVLGRATVLMCLGLVLGLVGAAALEHLVRAFLFNARPFDPDGVLRGRAGTARRWLACRAGSGAPGSTGRSADRLACGIDGGAGLWTGACFRLTT